MKIYLCENMEKHYIPRCLAKKKKMDADNQCLMIKAIICEESKNKNERK